MRSQRKIGPAGTLLSTTFAVLLTSTAAAQEDRSPLAFDIGTGVTVTPYGYIKLDAVWDDGFDLGKTTAAYRNIGIPGGPASGRFNDVFLNETRIGVNVTSGDFLFKLEGDFFGDNNTLRLRLGYFDWQYFRVGQDWTNFMSVQALPSTIDFQGTGATPFARVPLVRVTVPFGQSWTVSAAVEQDVEDTGDPAFTVSTQYDWDRGFIFASALSRDADFAGGNVEGWGVNVSAKIDAWQDGSVRAILTTGDGYADYLAVGYSGAELVNGPAAGRVDAAMLSVTQQVTERFLVAATGSWLWLPDATGAETRNLRSLHLSGFYKIAKNTTLMGEYFYGNRKQNDGASFDTNRLHLSVKYDF